jgi:TRAP transporter 4TM/12TM fusion protein
MAKVPTTVPKVEITRYESLPQPLKIICLVLFTIGIGLFIFYIFGWSIQGRTLEFMPYYYLLFACFSTCVFLTMPGRKKDRNRIPWYDLILSTLVFGICIYFTLNAWRIVNIGWVPAPHTLALVLACIILPLAIEGGRRMAGTPFLILCLLLGFHPAFAQYMPGFLWGVGLPLDVLVSSFAYGQAGMLGVPARVMGEILIGFLLLTGMLMASGAGTFFLNLALALLGRFRGGPAKVAVLASGFFGSLSGSPVANVASTGAITIPAMKRLGYPLHYAGAIEAVASTGGAIMPPVMGSVAFIMVIVTGIPYGVIVAAAAIPAILYYYGLLIQVDANAAKIGLRGLPREDMPSLRKTLKDGWPFIVVIAFLVFGLLYMRWEVLAAIYASGLMFLFSFTRRETMMTPRKIVATLAIIGNLVTYVMAVLLPVGFILTGVQVTGTLTAWVTEIVSVTGVNLVVILLVAAVICYLFGMVGMASIPYIVLAVTTIPLLVGTTGLNQLGLHLFTIYFLLMANITPPVAIAAFVSAGIAGAHPIKTAFTAMRLAIVLYFIPFFYVFNPALILEGPITETILLFVFCLLGIGILASGLEGYMLKVGRLRLWSRPPLVVAGFLIALPGLMTTVIGAALTALIIAVILIRKKTAAGKLIANHQ